MYSLKELQELIEKNLQSINYNLHPIELYEPIKYVLSNGGKRIRPALTLAACNLYHDSIEDSINAAMGIEVFHNFTLLHDDIMDHAEIRRNQPTVHIKWDENRAILSGDAMLIKAYQLLTKSPADKIPSIFEVFNKTALEVCEGQQIDMNFETQKNVSIKEYLEMIRLKTAVLIAGSLKIGSQLAGASVEEADYMYDFGKNIGLAFQLQDDLLDSFGNIEQFGKKIGGDIIENKKTFLLIKAFEVADKKTLELLNKFIPGTNTPNEIKINSILDIYKNLNIQDITKNEIDKYYIKAMECLSKSNAKEERKEILKKFAQNLYSRSN